MKNLHFTSDTHFGHLKLARHRGFDSRAEMDELLVESWNARVRPGDTVWHLGDVSFAKRAGILALLSRLNGELHLVLGNHDRDIAKHPAAYARFASVQAYKELKLGSDGRDFIVLCHTAFRVWNKHHYGSLHLHGHSHGSLPDWGKSLDVGVDCNTVTAEMRPLHLDEVRACLDARAVHRVDYHVAP